VKPYTAETPLEERAELRRRFAAGDLQALVAIRCLDEGVDIPETERAFLLASTTNPRQYVQRRGRVLRPSPSTGKRRAYVHDFLAVPPPGAVEERLWETERRLVARELERVVEFAQLAVNGPVAMDKLGDLRQRYGLLHL
jgi:superfamily II DNA or RNA helicase